MDGFPSDGLMTTTIMVIGTAKEDEEPTVQIRYARLSSAVVE
jgi:hypothetical protein